MYLKSIEMQGFKSFANRIKLDFHAGITGIVGPNGSGKSNVADAVRWVLGEQSARQLRGSAMQDVIFSGTENRKPLGYAFVGITLDNSDGSLAVDSKEVVVSRRLFRSGESEYLLNQTRCRLKDIQELFYDTGIGKEGYSIIGQGQIDRILSGKPEEHREIFDEAAGIVKFKKRKDETLRKLSREEADLLRIKDILKELATQLIPLKEQSEKASVYLEKSEDLKNAELRLFSLHAEAYEKELQELQQKKQETGVRQDSVKRAFALMRVEYEHIEEEIGELDLKIHDTREDLKNSEIHTQEAEGQIRVLEEQIASARSSIGILRDRLTAIHKDKESRYGHKDGSAEDLSQIDLQFQEMKKKLSEAKEAYAVIEERIRNQEEGREKNRKDNIDLLNARTQIREDYRRYETMLEQTGLRKEDLRRRAEEDRRQQEEQQKEAGLLSKAEEELTRRIGGQEKELAAGKDEIAELLAQERALMTRLDERKNTDQKVTSRLESLKQIAERYEGYKYSIRRVMEQKQKTSGISGVVADLIQTDKRYELALETALGSALENIVTEDEETAKEMITYLKRNHFGRATFLPLTAMQNPRLLLEPEVLSEAGVIGRADTLVRTGKPYQRMVQNLLGRTLVVDTIDHAISIARKKNRSLRMVTLEGDLLNPGGAMTGGSFKNNTNLLGRKREILELQAKTEAAQKDIQKLTGQLLDIRKKKEQREEQIREGTEELQKLYVQQSTLLLQSKNLDNALLELEEKNQRSEKELADLDLQVKTIDERKKEIEEKLEQSKVREADLEDKIRSLLKDEEELREQLTTARREMEEAGILFSKVQQRREFVLEKIRNAEEEIQKLTGEEESIRKQIETEVRRTDERKADIQKSEEQIREYQDIKKDCAEAISSYLKKKEDLENRHKDFFEKRDALSEEKNKLEGMLLQLESRLERMEEKQDTETAYLYDQYQLTPDQLPPMTNREEIPDPAILQRKIGQLKSEIRKIGPVNVEAVSQYQEVRERHDFLETQHNDLVRSSEDLKKIIRQLEAGMRVQFKEKFEKIRESFGKVFAELFGGGKGELILTDPEHLLESGISIISQPPGKKLQNMMQLSGGEKALTAIALLFAIQSLKPSPFCLLDEIEAALDDSNVLRYAAYLHKLTTNTQFIIITHRRGTMTAADRLYGITMQEKGISTLVSVDLIEQELDA